MKLCILFQVFSWHTAVLTVLFLFVAYQGCSLVFSLMWTLTLFLLILLLVLRIMAQEKHFVITLYINMPQVHEDGEKIRRAPSHPLPIFDDNLKEETKKRTVYCKGFAKDGSVTLDNLLEFFKQYGPYDTVLVGSNLLHCIASLLLLLILLSVLSMLLLLLILLSVLSILLSILLFILQLHILVLHICFLFSRCGISLTESQRSRDSKVQCW